jgi:hypothetical protein
MQYSTAVLDCCSQYPSSTEREPSSQRTARERSARHLDCGWACMVLDAVSCRRVGQEDTPNRTLLRDTCEERARRGVSVFSKNILPWVFLLQTHPFVYNFSRTYLGDPWGPGVVCAASLLFSNCWEWCVRSCHCGWKCFWLGSKYPINNMIDLLFQEENLDTLFS